jgi:predicted cupin superfamily sugar epimerase
MQTVKDIIRILDLAPHPEGGYYRETFRDPHQLNGRSASTAIYFLLAKGEPSRLHRIDAVEVWHWYAGDSLALRIIPRLEAEGEQEIRLGPDLAAGERPQAIVPAGAWQSAETLGDWTLVGCTVAPGFEFSGFEVLEPSKGS